MKPGSAFLLLILFFAFIVQAQSQSYFKPAPKDYTPVNDYAGILRAAQIEALSLKMLHFFDTTGNVIVIITQNSLTDSVTGKKYNIDEAALQYFNLWGIGQKVKNNGVLIFVAKDDRQVRISTGRGIENLLTDNQCKEIIESCIIPEFKAANFYKGLDRATAAIFKSLAPVTIESKVLFE